ncbi:alpha/beta hydrolase family protein [Chloroflexota bacterium]
MSIKEIMFKAAMNRAPRVRGFTKKAYFAHPFLDGFFIWFALGNMKYGGAEVGEIYRVASRIVESDPMSWGREWTAEGARVEALATKLLVKGHRISARSAFLRAFTYYRTANVFYGPGETQAEMTQTFESGQSCFKKFGELADTPIEMIQIPYKKGTRYENKTMRGYSFLASDDGRKRPTVIFLNGAESMAEDAYFWTAAAGMERGYNIFAADIPGDMVTRIYDPEFILDDPSDAGLQALVDYTLSRPEVDPEKLAVLGVSMGGYKAGRIAQIDNRLKAVVANAPMLNAGKVLEAIKKSIKMGKGARDYTMRFCWQYGVNIEEGTPKENVNKLVDEVWDSFQVDPTKITCPFLAMYGENELGEEGAKQAREFYKLLGSETKVLRTTTEEEGAEAHCQLNNFGLQHQISYDWLDEVFDL